HRGWEQCRRTLEWPKLVRPTGRSFCVLSKRRLLLEPPWLHRGWRELQRRLRRGAICRALARPPLVKAISGGRGRRGEWVLGRIMRIRECMHGGRICCHRLLR